MIIKFLKQSKPWFGSDFLLLQKICAAEIFLKISAVVIFALSIFLRSTIDIGPDTGVYLDLGRKLALGGKYYYTFFESNFPLSFYYYSLQYWLSLWLHVSPIILSEIFINILGVCSIYWSAQILKRSTIFNNRAHYNLIVISYVLGFFLRANVIQLGEFGTKSSLLLICLFPYISFSFERNFSLTKIELMWRGILMGLIPCLKPHYLIFILFLEVFNFWQKKSLKFFFELDKLVMLLVGVLYLFLMIEFTPEFFEFVVPMWSKVYRAYDDYKVFGENVLHRLGGQTVLFCFVFLVFSRLKLSLNDKILLLLFCAVSILVIIENIGTIDQLGIFYAIATLCFSKIIYDLIISEKFSFLENKSIILVLLIWPLFDMEVLPGAILGVSGFVNVWWLIVLVYPFLFCRKIKKENPQKWLVFKARNLTTKKIVTLIFLYLLVLLSALLALKYWGGWGFVVVNLFALFFVLFFFEKIYANFYEKFSSFSVFLIMASVSCLLYYYVQPLNNLIPDKHYDTFPNKLSDKISYYSAIYAPQKTDSFLVFSDLIPHQFPVMNYLDKENYYVGNLVTLITQRGFLGSSVGFPLSSDRDKIFTLSYLFEDLKNQLRNKNVKILFINNGVEISDDRDRCLIGFLEYYFLDPEFRKIFLGNFRFQDRIFTSVPIKRLRAVNKKESDVFDNVKPSNRKVRYDFEVYVRKN